VGCVVLEMGVLKDTAIIILAAGQSQRLGHAKQLVTWHDKPLLQHTLDEAEAVQIPTYVVLGAHYNAIEDAIVVGHQTTVLRNDDWSEGMSSSIRCALLAVPESIAWVLFCVCDQPYISSDLFQNLIKKQQETQQPIVACAYSGTFGVPMLIHRQFFPALLALQGDAGAKKIVSQNIDKLATFDFPLGHIDIDTSSDIQFLTNNERHFRTDS